MLDLRGRSGRAVLSSVRAFRRVTLVKDLLINVVVAFIVPFFNAGEVGRFRKCDGNDERRRQNKKGS